MLKGGQAEKHDELAPFKEVNHCRHIQVEKGQFKVEEALEALWFDVLIVVHEDGVEKADKSV